MRIDRLNQWLSLVASVGVLLGLVLIIYELNQNRDMMRAQTRNELFQGSMDLFSMSAASPELAEAIVKANEGQDLTPVQAHMYGIRSESVFRYWENAHYQYRMGLYDEVEFSRHLDTMKVVLRDNPGLVQYWCGNRLLYSEPFMAEIDSITRENQCP